MEIEKKNLFVAIETKFQTKKTTKEKSI